MARRADPRRARADEATLPDRLLYPHGPGDGLPGQRGCQGRIGGRQPAREGQAHKKQKAQHRRLEAKQWAITRTYIDPILRYFPTDVAVQQDKQEQLSAYLHDVEDAVHAFLLWLWVCYQDIEAHAHHDQITPAKTALRVLRRHKGKQGTDEVPLPQLQSRVNRQLNVGLSPHELLEVLEEMAMTNDDYSIRAWKANEDPENVRPKNPPFIEDITVELCYDEDYSPTYIGFLANHAEPDPAQ